MLLTQLHETITRRAKTTEELQKLIDISGSTGIEAVSSDSVKVTAPLVHLQNIITPGRLPFKFEAVSGTLKVQVHVPTLRSFHGMEALFVQDFEVGRTTIKKGGSSSDWQTIENKAETLVGMPKATGKVRLNNMPELKSLDGLNVRDGFSLELTYCPQVASLAQAKGVRSIQLMGCENISLQDFPESCEHLDISYQTIKRGLPWFITIPPSCKVLLSTSKNGVPFANNELPLELAMKIINYQKEGKSSRTHLLEIQADLIDADFDHLAEL